MRSINKAQGHSSNKAFILVAVIAVALGITANLFLKSPKEDARNTAPLQISSGTLIPNPRPLLPFSLTDHSGKNFSHETIKGHWQLLSFGYTHCPDICPTTLAMLARVDDQINKHTPNPNIQTAFISIDPQRDTVEKLANYMPYFNPRFLGVTGTTPELENLTRQLGVLYARVETDGSVLDYLMDHSSTIILLNPKGEYQAVFSAPHAANQIAEDLIRITSSWSE
ncbi:SCO family protein [Sedimenticola selenatireducens]|jgi:protein SCO1/2|nr:SCO family protein [Sedimenticola selenatireducens]